MLQVINALLYPYLYQLGVLDSEIWSDASGHKRFAVIRRGAKGSI